MAARVKAATVVILVIIKLTYPMTTVELVDLVEVGALNDGKDLFFRGKATDGSDARVVLPHGYLGKLITYLYQAGAIAERERGERPAGEFTMTMLNPTGIGVHPMTDGSGRVAIEIGLDQGVSILVPLPPETIPQLRRSLWLQLEQSQVIARRRQN